MFPPILFLLDNGEIVIPFIGQSGYVCEHTQPWRVELYTYACILCSGAEREEDNGMMSRAQDCHPERFCSEILWEPEAGWSFLASNRIGY